MKKKICLLTATFVMCLMFGACGSEKGSIDGQESTEKSQESTEAIVRDLPEGDYTEMGEGEFYISLPGGTSKEGNVPVIYLSSDEETYQIGINAFDFNGGALSYIYVDGVLIEKRQLADSQGSIEVGSNHLTVGIHHVEVVQYENDDTSSNMATYRKSSYEVKEN